MRLLRNIAVFTVIDAAGLAVGLLTSPITTRLLTPDQYGAQPLLMAVWSIVAIVQFAGMDSAFIIYNARKDQDRRKVLVTTSVVATLATVAVWLAFSVFSLGTPLLPAYAGVTRIELAGFLLWVLANTLLAWQLQLLRFMHEAVRFARVTLIGRIASVLVAIPVMYMLPQEQRLAATFYTYAAFAWISVLLAMREVRAAGNHPFDRIHYTATLVKPMMMLGAALIPGALVYSLCSVTDKLLLGWHASPADVAVYSLAGAVAGVALVLKLAFSRAWDPHMVDWLATGNPAIYLPKLQMAADSIAPAVLLLTLLALAWGDTLFSIIFPAAYAGAGAIMPVLVLAGTLSTLGLVAIATETLSGKARYRLQVYLGGLAVNLAFAANLIPGLGAIGAAYAALAGEITVLLLWAVVGRRILGNLPLRWTAAALWPGVALLCCLFYRPGVLTGSVPAEQWIISVLCLGSAWHLLRATLEKMGLQPQIVTPNR